MQQEVPLWQHQRAWQEWSQSQEPQQLQLYLLRAAAVQLQGQLVEKMHPQPFVAQQLHLSLLQAAAVQLLEQLPRRLAHQMRLQSSLAQPLQPPLLLRQLP